jgi:hypothetical protein
VEAESGCRQTCVEHAPSDLAQPRGVEHRLDVHPRDPHARLEELEDGCRHAGAHVEDARGPLECGERGPGHVPDEDVVALLAPVSVDVRSLSRGETAEEDGDDAGLSVRILARPEDVPVAERGVLAAVQAVVGREVLLGGELGDAVGRERASCRRLGRWLLALAVDCAPRGGEDDADTVLAGRLQDPDRPEDVHLAVVVGPLHRDADVNLRGEVEARIRPPVCEERAERLAVPDVAYDELGAVVHVLPTP